MVLDPTASSTHSNLQKDDYELFLTRFSLCQINISLELVLIRRFGRKYKNSIFLSRSSSFDVVITFDRLEHASKIEISSFNLLIFFFSRFEIRNEVKSRNRLISNYLTLWVNTQAPLSVNCVVGLFLFFTSGRNEIGHYFTNMILV